MKKAFKLIITLLIVAAVTVGVFVLLWSPEFALLRMGLDVKKNGIDGLLPHLTGDALTTVEEIIELRDNELIAGLISLVPEEDAEAIADNASQIEWSVGDIEKDGDSARFPLNFNYKDNIIGSVIVVLERVEHEWKASRLDELDFSKLDLGFGDLKDFSLGELFGD